MKMNAVVDEMQERRMRALQLRGLAEAVMHRLKIQPGNNLVMVIGIPTAKTNLEAIAIWLNPVVPDPIQGDVKSLVDMASKKLLDELFASQDSGLFH